MTLHTHCWTLQNKTPWTLYRIHQWGVRLISAMNEIAQEKRVQEAFGRAALFIDEYLLSQKGFLPNESIPRLPSRVVEGEMSGIMADVDAIVPNQGGPWKIAIYATPENTLWVTAPYLDNAFIQTLLDEKLIDGTPQTLITKEITDPPLLTLQVVNTSYVECPKFEPETLSKSWVPTATMRYQRLVQKYPDQRSLSENMLEDIPSVAWNHSNTEELFKSRLLNEKLKIETQGKDLKNPHFKVRI